MALADLSMGLTAAPGSRRTHDPGKLLSLTSIGDRRSQQHASSARPGGLTPPAVTSVHAAPCLHLTEDRHPGRNDLAWNERIAPLDRCTTLLRNNRMQSKDKTAVDPRKDFDREPCARKWSGATDEGQGPLSDDARPPQLPVFSNPMGVRSIEIGVTAFDCIGLLPPHDHPHVYINMGEQADIQCPYCSTRYRFNPALRWNETIPPDCCTASA
ncbi:MAG: zinc-finger domain-containing protein [Sphingomicrobium sp.]